MSGCGLSIFAEPLATFCEMRCRRGKSSFGVVNHLRNVMLPLERDTAEIRLVANLVIQIVELVQLVDDLADHSILYRKEPGMFVERINMRAVLRPDSLNVVFRIHRTDIPLLVLVHRAEQDSSRRRCRELRPARENRASV